MRPGQEAELVLNGQTFKIKKFTPETACFWAFRLLGDLAFTDDDQVAEQIKTFIRGLDKKQSRELQQDCLGQVIVRMESGAHPLINEMGAISVDTLSNDQVFELVLGSFAYSMRDFFAQARMGSIMETVAGLFRTTGPENSSSSPSA
jgi:hypothetical protein